MKKSSVKFSTNSNFANLLTKYKINIWKEALIISSAGRSLDAF